MASKEKNKEAYARSVARAQARGFRSPAQERRYKGLLRGQTVQEARGHGRTAEHGIEPRTERGRAMRGERGRMYEVTRGGDIKFALDRAVREHGKDVRVEVITYTPTGEYVLLKENAGRKEQYQGIRAEFLAKQLHEHRTFEAGIQDLTTSYGKQKITRITRATVRVLAA